MESSIIEIGQAIAQAREQKGMSLEQIAEQTRINLKYLRDIEEGRFDFLPRPYVMAYVKLVARLVDLDGEALIRRWHELESAATADDMEVAETPSLTKEPMPPPDSRLTPSGQETSPSINRPVIRATQPMKSRDSAAPWRPDEPMASGPAIPYLKEVAIGFAVFAAMALLLYFSSRSSKSTDETKREPVREIPFDQVAKDAAAQQERKPLAVPEIVTPPRQQRPMRLEVRAEDSVWVQVVTDQKDSTDYSMRAGNLRAWNAVEQFYVRFGNAGAVRILLDGKDLGEIGTMEQMGSALITREGIKNKRLRSLAPRPASDSLRTPSPVDTSSQN